MTRKWKNRSSIIDSIKLFLIDEIHVLGENSRGATIEAVISRMKTYAYNKQSNNENSNKINNTNSLRFIAISATIPNIEDVGCFLDNL
jgi:ATP-dependent DNA helicase HFM1/MER3